MVEHRETSEKERLRMKAHHDAACFSIFMTGGLTIFVSTIHLRILLNAKTKPKYVLLWTKLPLNCALAKLYTFCRNRRMLMLIMLIMM